MYEPHVKPFQVHRNQMDADLVVVFPERLQLAALTVVGLGGAAAGFVAPRFISPISAVVTYLFWLGGGLSLAAGLWMFWRILRPRPSLIADSAGIADYTFWGEAVFLRWEDIAAIEVVEPAGRRDSQAQTCLVVRPRPGTSAARRLTGAARLTRRLKSGLASDGVRVSETLLPIPVTDLRDRLRAMWHRHTGATG